VVDERLILLLLMILGVLSRNALIVTSAGILLILHFMRLQIVFSLLQRRGIEAGLIFLLIAVLIPFASGEVGWREIRESFSSFSGLAGILGGVVAAVLSAHGISLLKGEPEVSVGLLVGTILGVVLFRGIPVGPLAAAGFAAVLLAILR
jgi:uncharacterized membrane protein (DUF441 family)